MKTSEVIAAWNAAPVIDIHPTRGLSEDDYWQTGRDQAESLSTVLDCGATVVDFGCGDGRVARPLWELGYDVIGADSSPAMLSRLPAHIHSVLSEGPGLSALLDGPVDAVVCLAVLIHHDWETGERMIRAFRECLVSGGRMVLDWPSADRPEERRHWIGVTTWAEEWQNRLAADLGMHRVTTDPMMSTSAMATPWLVYQVD